MAKKNNVWVDLAKECSKHCPIEGFENEKIYPKSCWFCEHFGMWGTDGMWNDSAEGWTCKFKVKETERKMKETIRFKGQKTLLEIPQYG